MGARGPDQSAFVEKELKQGVLCQPFNRTVQNDLGYYVVMRDWLKRQV